MSKMEKTVGEAGLKGKFRISVLDMSQLWEMYISHLMRCLISRWIYGSEV